MKLTLWHRFLKHGLTDGPATPRHGTTIVHEERGSGTGAVLFQPYAVSEFVPDPEEPEAPALAEFAASRPAATPSSPPAPAAPRTPNPVADEWRRNSPEVFQTVARRFCARAPKAAQELREYCLSGQHDRLAQLATALKPTLSLFDMSAAEAAERVEKQAAAGRAGSLAHDVLALEHEVWRVADAWEQGAAPAASTEAHP